MGEVLDIRRNPDGSVAGVHYLSCLARSLEDSEFVVLMVRYIEDAEHNARCRAGLDQPREFQMILPLTGTRGMADALRQAADALEAGGAARRKPH